MTILATDPRRAGRFTPAARATWPVVDNFDLIRNDLDDYHVLNSFRPWWISQRYLPRDERAVDLDRTFVLLSLLAGAGLAMSVVGLGRTTTRQTLDEPRETSARLEPALV